MMKYSISSTTPQSIRHRFELRKGEWEHFSELNCLDCEAFSAMTLKWVRSVINYETRTLPHSPIPNGKQEVKTHQNLKCKFPLKVI